MLRVIPEHAHILLIALEYDQDAVPGPPHSVTEAEVEKLFGARCRIELLERTETSKLPPHFVKAGLETGAETVYNIVKDH
jgi:thiopurine S-methyltransferase